MDKIIVEKNYVGKTREIELVSLPLSSGTLVKMVKMIKTAFHYLAQRGPIPSNPCNPPVEDSACVTKNRTGLCVSKARPTSSKVKTSPAGFANSRTSPPIKKATKKMKEETFLM